jgi:hypothetical protein
VRARALASVSRRRSREIDRSIVARFVARTTTVASGLLPARSARSFDRPASERSSIDDPRPAFLVLPARCDRRR